MRIGTDVNNQVHILKEDELKEHVVIFGRIGRGKSKLSISILDQLIDQGEGVTLVDPDNDTAEELRDKLLERWNNRTGVEKQKMFYFEPSFDRAVRLDPFEIKDVGLKYDSVLSKRIEGMMQIMGRTAGFDDYKDFRLMARHTENALYWCAMKVNGKHYGVPDALFYLNFGGGTHQKQRIWERKYEKIRSHLPEEIRQDIDRLKSIPKTLREKELMSTVNLFRSFLRGPLIKHVFSTDGPSVDFRKAVRQRHTHIWNFGLTDEFSKVQRDALASIVLIMEGDACYHERVPRYTMVEEASSVLGAEMNETLRQARKRKQRLILVVQDIAGLRNNRMDISQTALSQPGVTISFQQKGREELEELGYIFGTGMLDFSLVWKPMDRPDGWDQIVIPEYSESNIEGRNWNKQDSIAYTLSSGNEIQFGRTTGKDDTSGIEIGTSKGTTKQKQKTNSFEETTKTGEGTVDKNWGGFEESHETIRSNDRHHTTREGESESEGVNTSKNRSAKKSHTERFGTEWRNSRKESESGSLTHIDGLGGSAQKQKTKTHRVHLLPRTMEEWYPQGLLYSFQEQYAMMAKTLRLLDRGEILICSENQPTHKITVDYVSTPFERLPTFRRIAVNNFNTWLSEAHDCFFKPEKEKQCQQKPVGAVDASKKRKGTNGSK